MERKSVYCVGCGGPLFEDEAYRPDEPLCRNCFYDMMDKISKRANLVALRTSLLDQLYDVEDQLEALE